MARDTRFDWVNPATIITFIVGSLFGSGMIWTCKEYRLKQDTQIVEFTRTLTDRLFLYSALNEEYISLLREYEKHDLGGDKRGARDIESRINNNRIKAKTIYSEIENLEKRVAEFENRPPRKFISEPLPPLLKIQPN
jgi:hypothetical protein